MPTAQEILKKRGVSRPVGQRFGITGRSIGRHEQGAQVVAKVVSLTHDGRAVMDISTARIFRQSNSNERVVYDEKTGRKVVELSKTIVR